MAMARQAEHSDRRKPFYLYIDEFQNFITPSMADLLSGARKYKFGLVLAHQDMRQLWERDKEVAHSIVSNPGTRVCFRLGDYDASRLEESFSTFKSEDLRNLGTGEAIVRVERPEYDFNINVPFPEEIPSEKATQRINAIREHSRERYATKLEPREPTTETSAQPVAEESQKTKEVPSPPPPSKPSPKKREPVKLKEEGMDQEALAFLEEVEAHPMLLVTKLYKEAGLSAYKGDKLKNTLIKEGLLVQEEVKTAKTKKAGKTLKLTEKGRRTIGKKGNRGKGGSNHQEFQRMLAEQAKDFGWKAKIEERIPGTRESVDVGLTLNDYRVAIEISETTDAEHEMGNAQKCIDAGYDYVLCVSDHAKHRAEMKRLAKSVFTLKDRERLKFIAPGGVAKFLMGIVSDFVVSENKAVSTLYSEQKQLLGHTEAAEFLGVSPHTLYEWVSQKKISVVKVGNRNKYQRKDLEAWLKRRTQREQNVDI
jgi:excisionase family DNA binding protein